MKHAGTAALDALEDFFAAIRRHTELHEKKRGTFYRKSSAFLHFHEDPAGFFADLKVGGEFERFPVNTPAERRRLLTLIARLLAD